MRLDRFSNLGQYLPPQSLLVLNDTKVVPARTYVTKETGGRVEVLFLLNEWSRRGPIPAIVNKKLNIGSFVSFDPKHRLRIIKQNENIFFFKPEFSLAALYQLLYKKGMTPIPKYIKGTPLSESKLRKEYQAIFARHPASVAAPTASLHFTDRLLRKLRNQGIAKTFVTLNVGLGTFAPLNEDNVKTGTLHAEWVSVPASSVAAIRQAKASGRPVVAVGTTVVRTLESQADGILFSRTKPISGMTNIFIRPPYQFKIVDALITNFHLPASSLMMLVQAFLEDKKATRSLVDLCQIAIKDEFRFYSFGDGMLIT